MKKEEKKPSISLIGLSVAFLGATLILIFAGPELARSRLQGWNLNPDNPSQIGDVFGGTLSPFIAIIAAILTFAAFYIQYEANKEQREQFEKQARDTSIERFEGRYFEMIRLHRSNVEELDIQHIVTGRKVFTTFYFELRYIYFTLEKYHDTFTPEKPLSTEQITNLAYLIFFFGIGHVTDNVFSELTPQYFRLNFFQSAISSLKSDKSKYFRSEKKIGELTIEHKKNTAVFKMIYEPFTGHGTKIGHYYRHLYQAVKYVSSQDEELISKDDKYSYVKTLRAQLSNFEQILFYYNSVSILGRNWIEDDFIRDYHLIANLPLAFVDFGIRPEVKFAKEVKEIKDFFDWNALKPHLQ